MDSAREAPRARCRWRPAAIPRGFLRGAAAAGALEPPPPVPNRAGSPRSGQRAARTHGARKAAMAGLCTPPPRSLPARTSPFATTNTPPSLPRGRAPAGEQQRPRDGAPQSPAVSESAAAAGPPPPPPPRRRRINPPIPAADPRCRTGRQPGLAGGRHETKPPDPHPLPASPPRPPGPRPVPPLPARPAVPDPAPGAPPGRRRGPRPARQRRRRRTVGVSTSSPASSVQLTSSIRYRCFAPTCATPPPPPRYAAADAAGIAAGRRSWRGKGDPCATCAARRAFGALTGATGWAVFPARPPPPVRDRPARPAGRRASSRRRPSSPRPPRRHRRGGPGGGRRAVGRRWAGRTRGERGTGGGAVRARRA